MTGRIDSDRVFAAASPAGFGWVATRDDAMPYKPAAFHRIISQAVVDVAEGRDRLLVIQLPVQHGKTLTASVLTSAWFLGTHPNEFVIAASYSTDFAEDKIGAPARNLLEAYGDSLFRVSVDKRSSSRGRWDTTAGGGLVCAGIDKRVAGRRMDLAIIDDPVGGLEDVATVQARDRTWNWFLSELWPRRAPGCGIIVVMSRWSEDDFVGRLLKWAPTVGLHHRLLHFPAIALANDPLGREPGDALWPEVRDLAFLEEQRAAMGTRRFDAQFQGSPHPEDGSLFLREWFEQRFRPGTPLGFKKAVIFLDGAFKTGVANDRSALACWATNGRGYYVVDVWADRVEYPDLRAKCVAFWDRYRNVAPQVTFAIEDAASGTPLLQEFRRATNIPVVAVKVDRSKTVRAESVTPEFESGKVFLPEGAGWIDEFIAEHISFPAGRHDDIVDTTSGALIRLKQIAGTSASFFFGKTG